MTSERDLFKQLCIRGPFVYHTNAFGYQVIGYQSVDEVILLDCNEDGKALFDKYWEKAREFNCYLKELPLKSAPSQKDVSGFVDAFVEVLEWSRKTAAFCQSSGCLTRKRLCQELSAISETSADDHKSLEEQIEITKMAFNLLDGDYARYTNVGIDEK